MSLEIARTSLRATGEDLRQVDPLSGAFVYSPELWWETTGGAPLKLPVQPNQQDIYLIFQRDPKDEAIKCATLVYFDKVLGRAALEFRYSPRRSLTALGSEESAETPEDFVPKEMSTYSYEIDNNFTYPLSPQPIPIVRVEISDWAVDKSGRKKGKIGLKVINRIFGQEILNGGVRQDIVLSQSRFESLEEAEARAKFASVAWLREQKHLTNRDSFWVEKTRAFLFSQAFVHYERDSSGYLVKQEQPHLKLPSELETKFPQTLTAAEVIYV